MIFTGTVTPGYQFAPDEKGDTSKFNLGFLPTVAGTVTFAGGYADANVTAVTRTCTVQDLAGDILRVAGGHGRALGDRVSVSNAGGALPAGLSASYEYFLRPDTTNPGTDFTLHYTLQGALNNTQRVDVADNGSGTHTLTHWPFATGHAFIFDPAGNTWERGVVSPASLPDYQGNGPGVPGVRGAVPPAPPTSGDNYYLSPRGAWTAFPSPSDVGNNLYLNENVY